MSASQLHCYPTKFVEIYFVINISVNTFALLSSKQILIKKD